MGTQTTLSSQAHPDLFNRRLSLSFVLTTSRIARCLKWFENKCNFLGALMCPLLQGAFRASQPWPRRMGGCLHCLAKPGQMPQADVSQDATEEPRSKSTPPHLAVCAWKPPIAGLTLQGSKGFAQVTRVDKNASNQTRRFSFSSGGIPFQAPPGLSPAERKAAAAGPRSWTFCTGA